MTRLIYSYGIYKFQPRTVAYRNDFCLTCAAPRSAYCIRAFYFVHLIYIPILPLGYWRAWHCFKCNRDPHVYPGSTSLKPLFLPALLLFAAVAWFVPDPDSYTWAGRLLLTLALLGSLWYVRLEQTPAGVRDVLKQIQPASEVECAVCGGPLVVADTRRCAECDAERMVLS
jgi:hypothetical protein